MVDRPPKPERIEPLPPMPDNPSAKVMAERVKLLEQFIIANRALIDEHHTYISGVLDEVVVVASTVTTVEASVTTVAESITNVEDTLAPVKALVEEDHEPRIKSVEERPNRKVEQFLSMTLEVLRELMPSSIPPMESLPRDVHTRLVGKAKEILGE